MLIIFGIIKKNNLSKTMSKTEGIWRTEFIYIHTFIKNKTFTNLNDYFWVKYF